MKISFRLSKENIKKWDYWVIRQVNIQLSKRLPNHYPQWPPFCILIAMRLTVASNSLQQLVLPLFFILSTLHMYVVLSHCSFNVHLPTNDTDHLFMCLCDILIIATDEVSFKSVVGFLSIDDLFFEVFF